MGSDFPRGRAYGPPTAMNPLLAARAQMEVSLAFHMVFAAIGIGLPLLMVLAEAIGLRTGDPRWRTLARRQARVTAVLFAIGAVSGTALSFELGLLWPRFMRLAGPVIGPTFALEGYAFFLEAIFLGLYLYGWDRLSPRAHLLAGAGVALTGLLSGAFVVAVNAWMQCPPPASLTILDPWATFRSAAWVNMAVHSTLSCYVSVGFAVAGAAAWSLLKKRPGDWHRPALSLSLTVASVAAVLQLVSGDRIAKMVAVTQPVKLAAMEAHFETARGAAIAVGGLVDQDAATLRGALVIPKVLSVLAFGDPDATVRGLHDFPRELWPRVAVVHTAFDVMVGAGTFLVALSAAWWLWRFRTRATPEAPVPPLLLRSLVFAAPLGFIALEAGWLVTEAGRQPWTIQGVLRTADAATRSPHAVVTFVAFSALYAFLGVVVVGMLRYLARTPVKTSEQHP
ncbi:MAG: cytochrome ubiquinol oxidase subunit I [Myxococcales bacterium]|nr:cytochrome ubiquinol oxidase subunit I [Myxococcales bacterium]